MDFFVRRAWRLGDRMHIMANPSLAHSNNMAQPLMDMRVAACVTEDLLDKLKQVRHC